MMGKDMQLSMAVGDAHTTQLMEEYERLVDGGVAPKDIVLIHGDIHVLTATHPVLTERGDGMTACSVCEFHVVYLASHLCTVGMIPVFDYLTGEMVRRITIDHYKSLPRCVDKNKGACPDFVEVTR